MGTAPGIRPLDLDDDEQLRRFHEIGRRAECEDGRPWNSFFTRVEMSTLLREQVGDRRWVGYGAFRGREMVGAGLMLLFLLDNRDKAWVFPAVEPEQRGHGIGGALLEALVVAAHDDGRREVLSDSALAVAERHSSGVLRFADAHGFTVSNIEIYRVLRLPVAHRLLAEVAAESGPHHQDYDIETYVDEMPDRYLASYCHLLNQLPLDAPTGEVEFEAAGVTPQIERDRLARSRRMGRTLYRTVAVRDGEAVAHSDLMVQTDGHQAHQLGTLVRRDHRGHRLGTAVKVANLRVLQQARPDVDEVHTQNAETNPWMVAINERLGFEPVGVCPDFQRLD